MENKKKYFQWWKDRITGPEKKKAEKQFNKKTKLLAEAGIKR